VAMEYDINRAIAESLADSTSMLANYNSVHEAAESFLKERGRQICVQANIRNDGNCLLDCLSSLVGGGLDLQGNLREGLITYIQTNIIRFENHPQFLIPGAPLDEVFKILFVGFVELDRTQKKKKKKKKKKKNEKNGKEKKKGK